jgi:hypothetical protein
VPFEFDLPPNGELRQGEILGPIVELRVAHPAIDIPEGIAPVVNSIAHRLMIIVSADCDLLRDFTERQLPVEGRQLPNLLNHVLLCDAYSREEIAGSWPKGFGSADRRHAAQNQNERYHCFPRSRIRGADPAAEFEAVHLDFKNVLGIPAESIYEGINAGAIARRVRVPEIYLQDLTHRLYGFLSRIATDFE